MRRGQFWREPSFVMSSAATRALIVTTRPSAVVGMPRSSTSRRNRSMTCAASSSDCSGSRVRNSSPRNDTTHPHDAPLCAVSARQPVPDARQGIDARHSKRCLAVATQLRGRRRELALERHDSACRREAREARRCRRAWGGSRPRVGSALRMCGRSRAAWGDGVEAQAAERMRPRRMGLWTTATLAPDDMDWRSSTAREAGGKGVFAIEAPWKVDSNRMLTSQCVASARFLHIALRELVAVFLEIVPETDWKRHAT